jgi:hypothetical protein
LVTNRVRLARGQSRSVEKQRPASHLASEFLSDVHQFFCKKVLPRIVASAAIPAQSCCAVVFHIDQAPLLMPDQVVVGQLARRRRREGRHRHHPQGARGSRALDRDQCRMGRLVDLVERHLHLLGDLFGARFAAEPLDQQARHAQQLVGRLDHVHRDTDGAALIGDGARHRLPNPPRRVGRKLEAAPVLFPAKSDI